MTTINKKTARRPQTHEGGKADHTSNYLQLRRSVMACLLWEDTFYESGEDITKRISSLIPKVSPDLVAALAVEARVNMKLRAVPMLLASEMIKHDTHRPFVKNLLPKILNRPDQMAELISMYWKSGRKKLPKSLEKGLALTFPKFDEYQLAKYNRDKDVMLRDVLFLSHARPINPEQSRLWKKLIGHFCSKCWLKIHDFKRHELGYCKCEKPIEAKLETPFTWEVELASGKDKKKAWTELLHAGKLPPNAVLKNLRNMTDVGVDNKLIVSTLEQMKLDKVLPFEILLANKYAPGYRDALQACLIRLISSFDKLKGNTLVLDDVSGSMYMHKIARRSDMTRADAGTALAILLKEVCENVDICTFSLKNVFVKGRGFDLEDAIHKSQIHDATYLMRSLNAIDRKYDRIIIITDEQSQDGIPEKQYKGASFQYILNVSVERNGIGYNNWMHIDGFSEHTIRYINEFEKFSKKEGE
jgi:hypothetical protein